MPATDHDRQPINTPMLAGGGEMGALMRAIDWTRTALGPIEGWPQSLRTSVSVCLHSRFPILLWWGPELVMLYNDAYRPMLGSSKHPGAMGRAGREVWPEIWAIIGPMLEGVLARGEATWSDDQLLLLDRNGYLEECYFTFSYSPIHDETGSVGGIFCAVTETTERVLGERRLKTLHELGEPSLAEARTAEQACRAAARTLAENAHDFPFALIYLLDAEGRQARLAEAINLPAGARASHTVVGIGAADDVWGFGRVVATNQSQVADNLEARFGQLPAGPWQGAVVDRALVLPLAKTGVQDVPAGFLVTGISPRLALTDAYRSFLELAAQQLATAVANAQVYEQERQRAEALAELDRAKTTFFSNISHEFRTPLTLMLGPLEELRQQLNGALPPEERQQLDVAYRNALRLLKLVNTLLDFSRIEAGRMDAAYEPTDLAAYTADLASLFRSAIERAGLTLVVDCPPHAEPAYVDRDMWEKIVFNLLSNALKFTPAGQIAVGMRPRGDLVELTVSDTGIGIPAAELPHLFERFHRVAGAGGRTLEGTGIGLALVQELARLHGGSVRVESELGRGSTFVVAIPRGRAHLPADRVGAARGLASTALRGEAYVEEALRWLPEPETRGLELDAREYPSSDTDIDDYKPQATSLKPRLLLADDNADMREYLRRLLSPHYQVQAVPNGAAALAAAREQPPDLVLADVMMPELDGFGLLRALRADDHTRAVPIVLLSARAGEEARLEGLAAGADDYLVKPFSARELLARVEARLELARLRHEALGRQQALQASETRLRMAVGAGAIGVWDIDLRTGARIWSDQAKAIYGLAPQEPMSYERQIGLIHPDDRARVQALIAAFRDEGTLKQLNFEHRIVRPDGSLRWVVVRGEAIYDRAALPVRLIGTLIDITERVVAEQRLQRLQEVTARFAATQSLDEVRRIVLGQVLQALQADSGGLRRVTPDGLVVDQIELSQQVGEQIARRYAHLSRLAQHPAAEAARDGRAVFARDAGEIIQRYPGLADVVIQQRTQATAHLPLKRGAEVFGVLSMNFAEPRAWDDAEQAFALALADRAAIAYERARLFEAEQQVRRLAEQTTERLTQLQRITAALGAVLTREQVADAIVQEVKHALRAPAGIVFALSQDATVLEQLTSAGYREAITTAAVRVPVGASVPIADCAKTGESIFVESFEEYAALYPERAGIAKREGFAAFVAVPLQLDARIVGALGITFMEPRAFSAGDRAFVEAIARQCAQALERARLYEAERASEARYRELADSMPQLVWTSDADGVVDYYNSRVAEYAGITRTDEGRWDWQPVLHPDDLHPTLAAWREAMQSGQPYSFEHRIQMRDGSFRWHLSRAMPALDSAGRIVKWFGTATNIHEQYLAAEDARCLADIGEIIRLTADAGAMLGRVTQIVGDYLQVRRCMVIEIDLVRDLGLVRQQYCRGVPPVATEYRLTAYSEVAQIEIDHGRTIVNLDSRIDPRTAAIYEATYQPYGERAYVAVPLLRDGVRNGTFWVSDDVPRRWEAREVWLLETVAERVWLAIEKLRAEQALRANEERLQVLYAQEQAAREQAEAASRLKDEFLATVSHELRTPLTSILGYGQIIQTRKRDEAYVARTIDKIVSSAKAQAQLIDDLLDVARIVTGKLRVDPRPIDMATVIQAAVETLRPAIDAKGLRLQIELDPEAVAIVGDPNRLQQVVWNLVSNAVKFTPSGGIVRVHFETRDRHAQLTVSDTGQGIRPEFLPFVFDRFRQAESTSTRAHGGLGLGLAIVRHLVEMHGGTVGVESAGAGEGATFTVRLPIAAGEPAVPSQDAPGASGSAAAYPPELAGLRVLIVDDQPDIVELVHDMLAPCGVEIRTALAARDALAALCAWRPDVLVSDIAMPGEDGFWLIRSIRALAPEDGGDTPAVALTAYVRVEDRLQVLAAGFQLYVPKPVEPAELLDAVARLARMPAADEP